MSPKPKLTLVPKVVKKLSTSQYLKLESEWYQTNSRYAFGRWFLDTYFPSVTDNTLYRCQSTHQASLLILESYVQK